MNIFCVQCNKKVKAERIFGYSDYCALRQSWIDRYGKKIIGNIHDNPNY